MAVPNLQRSAEPDGGFGARDARNGDQAPLSDPDAFLLQIDQGLLARMEAVMSLNGLEVVSLESRRADLVEELVARHGGKCFNAPSVRELPLEENAPCLQLVRDLAADRYEALLLLTGVGAEYLRGAAQTIGLEEQLLAALGRVTTVSRGPKPAAVLRKWGVPADLNVPEPNTWREVADRMRVLEPCRVAVQEYGAPNPNLVEALEAQGFHVTPIAVYRWALPRDLSRLKEAVRRIVTSNCDVVLLLSSVQLIHLLEVARRLDLEVELRNRLNTQVVKASIGPVMTDALRREGLEPDFTPKHPKLAIFVKQLAEEAPELVRRLRTRSR